MNDRLSDAEVLWHTENPPDVMGNSKQLQRLAVEVLEWRRIYPRRVIVADHPFEPQTGSSSETDTAPPVPVRSVERGQPDECSGDDLGLVDERPVVLIKRWAS